MRTYVRAYVVLGGGRCVMVQVFWGRFCAFMLVYALLVQKSYASIDAAGLLPKAVNPQP